MRVIGERPVGHRHNANAITEKLLEAIANTSCHFSELAMKQIDAVAGQRVFVDAGGNRDFVACVEYYNRQWAHAVKRKILIPSPPARRGQAAEANRAGVETLSRTFSVKTSLGQMPPPVQEGDFIPRGDSFEAYSTDGRQL